MELAAFASAAVPGLTPAGAAFAPDDAADFVSAVLLDDAGKRWRVRCPKHAEASVRLETEQHVLKSFTPGVRAELPFLMPTVAGTVRHEELTTYVYSHLPGTTRSIDELVEEPGRIATELGRIMAAIHDLPLDLVHNADLPSYTANEFRQRKLNELDQAATTGKIPSGLLLRWENALEDVALWQFSPTVVHGDLHEDNLLINNGRISAVNGWTDLRVGDPADDFAWLVAANDQSFADRVLESYSVARAGAPDRHLLRRAALSAEFALAQWLVRGISTGEAEIVAEAEEMLANLQSDITEFGGQPIAAEPPRPQHSPAVTPMWNSDDKDAATAAPERQPSVESTNSDTARAPGSRVSVAPIPVGEGTAAPTHGAEDPDGRGSAHAGDDAAPGSPTAHASPAGSAGLAEVSPLEPAQPAESVKRGETAAAVENEQRLPAPVPDSRLGPVDESDDRQTQPRIV